jgi:hypothetical protein
VRVLRDVRVGTRVIYMERGGVGQEGRMGRGCSGYCTCLFYVLSCTIKECNGEGLHPGPLMMARALVLRLVGERAAHYSGPVR